MRIKPDLTNIDPASLTAPPVSTPPDARTAAQEAIARAAEAATRGHLGKADRETRLAERLERLARNTAQDAPEQSDPGPSPDAFRLDLERRINVFQAEERRERDRLKARDPAAWQAAYEAARAEVLASVDALWIGDGKLFEEPEGGYPDFPFKI